MSQQEIVLFIIRLILSGLASFFAILLWNKTRDIAWMSIVAGAIIGYAGLVFDMLVRFGFAPQGKWLIFGIPLSTLLFASIPSLFFIIAFIIMLCRKN